MDSLKNSLTVATGAFVATQFFSTALKTKYDTINWDSWRWSTVFSAFGGALAAYTATNLIKSSSQDK